MPQRSKLLTVKVNAQLASEYRDAYQEAFVGGNNDVQSLEQFIGGFIEDRLVEEIEFARAETPRSSR
jgi:hypothetical protein